MVSPPLDTTFSISSPSFTSLSSLSEIVTTIPSHDIFQDHFFVFSISENLPYLVISGSFLFSIKKYAVLTPLPFSPPYLLGILREYQQSIFCIDLSVFLDTSSGLHPSLFYILTVNDHLLAFTNSSLVAIISKENILSSKPNPDTKTQSLFPSILTITFEDNTIYDALLVSPSALYSQLIDELLYTTQLRLSRVKLRLSHQLSHPSTDSSGITPSSPLFQQSLTSPGSLSQSLEYSSEFVYIFRIHDFYFAILVSSLLAVLRHITFSLLEVPTTSPYFLGSLRFAGQSIPIFSQNFLVSSFSMSLSALSSSIVLIIEASDEKFAILVDEIIDSFSFSSVSLLSSHVFPFISPSSPFPIKGIFWQECKPVFLLDTEKLARITHTYLKSDDFHPFSFSFFSALSSFSPPPASSSDLYSAGTVSSLAPFSSTRESGSLFVALEVSSFVFLVDASTLPPFLYRLQSFSPLPSLFPFVGYSIFEGKPLLILPLLDLLNSLSPHFPSDSSSASSIIISETGSLSFETDKDVVTSSSLFSSVSLVPAILVFPSSFGFFGVLAPLLDATIQFHYSSTMSSVISSLSPTVNWLHHGNGRLLASQTSFRFVGHLLVNDQFVSFLEQKFATLISSFLSTTRPLPSTSSTSSSLPSLSQVILSSSSNGFLVIPYFTDFLALPTDIILKYVSLPFSSFHSLLSSFSDRLSASKTPLLPLISLNSLPSYPLLPFSLLGYSSVPGISTILDLFQPFLDDPQHNFHVLLLKWTSTPFNDLPSYCWILLPFEPIDVWFKDECSFSVLEKSDGPSALADLCSSKITISFHSHAVDSNLQSEPHSSLSSSVRAMLVETKLIRTHIRNLLQNITLIQVDFPNALRSSNSENSVSKG